MMKWSEIINIRRSCRSYEMDNITEEQRVKINHFIDNLDIPFPHTVEAHFFKGTQNKKLYSVLNSPMDNLAFLTETDYLSISKAGFVGEMIILYITSLGLSTCWYGHYTLSEMERVLPHLGKYKNEKQPIWGYGKKPVEGRRVIAITPVAYWKDRGLRLMDRIQFSAASFKRKPLSDLMDPPSSDKSLKHEIREILDLARKAPSSGNGQFWKFSVSEDQRNITVTVPSDYKHPKWEHPNVESGIAASHIWLGILEKGLSCDVDISLDPTSTRTVWTFKLKGAL